MWEQKLFIKAVKGLLLSKVEIGSISCAWFALTKNVNHGQNIIINTVEMLKGNEANGVNVMVYQSWDLQEVYAEWINNVWQCFSRSFDVLFF